MKLAEVAELEGAAANEKPAYKIYVDLDGVLVDFDKLMAELGFARNAVEHDKKAKSRFWQTIAWMAKRGQEFWGAMDPLPDADQLWSYVKKYNPEILSATGHVGNATEEKHRWVNKHLGGHVKVNLTRKSADKAQYAAPNHILIDDRKQSIEPWVAAGGIGILHTSAADTIAKLKELGL